MNFSDKSRYDSLFQQVTHKGGEYATNYIKISQNAQTLSVSVGNSYSEYELMHKFLENFYQGGRYSAQVAIQKAELGREEKVTDRIFSKSHIKEGNMQRITLNRTCFRCFSFYFGGFGHFTIR